MNLKEVSWDNIDKTFVIRVELLFVICLIMMCAFLVIMTIFFKFHIGLVFGNSTTIEHLESKRSETASPLDQYDVGHKYNWIQVFGMNKL